MSSPRTLKDGECLASVGFEFGFHPDTIWSADENEALRSDPYRSPYLLAKDEVWIPEKTENTENRSTHATHTFRRRGVPEKLKLRLLYDGEARAGVAYEIEVDGKALPKGVTGQEGELESWISPAARRVVITITIPGDDDKEVLEFLTGYLEPASTDAGVSARLNNLGLLDEENMDDEDRRCALELFQTMHGIEPVTGSVDEETRKALVKAHGC